MTGGKVRTLTILICSAFLLYGCAPAASTDVSADKANLSKKELSALAWKENVAGKPIVLRRTTLIVRDIEKSLAFYRDALGMSVQYDQELTSPGLTTRYKNDGTNRSRLVFLEADNEFVGVLGLWQFLDPNDKDLAEPKVADLTPGGLVFVFNTTDLEATFAKASKIPGTQILEMPEISRYPSEAGEIRTLVSMLTDPDGHAVELNQVLFDPRRE